ncbi:MAG: TetR family transcriptional regulator [Gemmatimonadetes bacterium]|nr:MAG: TetR family transcriptional regulator [Gemmatimonadota bacterium]
MKRKRTVIEAPGRGPGRPRDAKAHAAILGAAISLTREVGYDALAMDAIAARAGVGKATIYRYWSSKELLMAEAVEAIVRRVPLPDTGTTAGDLLVLMRATMTMYQDPATPPLLTGLIAAMARSPLIAERLRNGFIGVRRAAICEALRRGVRRGDLARGTDVELACDLLTGPMLWRSLMSGEVIHETYTVELVRRVLRAFAPPTPTPTAASRGRRT